MYRKVWLVWYGMGCRMYRYRMVHGMAWSGLMVSTNLLKLKFTTCKSRQLRCLRGKVHSFTWLPRWWWGGGWWLKIGRGCRLLQFWFHTFVICRTLQHWSSFHQYGKRWGRLRRAYGYWLYEKDEGVKYSSCFEGYWLWEKWGLRLKICKEGGEKGTDAVSFFINSPRKTFPIYLFLQTLPFIESIQVLYILSLDSSFRIQTRQVCPGTWVPSDIGK